MKRLICMSLLVLVFACTNLKYKPDIGFMVSAQANSPELLVRINGSPCKDMDGNVGLCAKRIASNKDITLSMDAQPYSYRFALTCSKIDADFSQDILENIPFKFAIDSTKFQDQRSFTCIGEVFPDDRDHSVSAKWNIRIVVYDSRYVDREGIYISKRDNTSYLVLGQHARYSKVKINGKWKNYKKKTKVKLKKKDVVEQAYTESERMRFNYYRF